MMDSFWKTWELSTSDKNPEKLKKKKQITFYDSTSPSPQPTTVLK
jgi:hypothetical protein